MDRYLYIFLDEAGNLDFSSNGTKYFTLTSVTKERPFNAYKDLCDLKYNLIEAGEDRERFHATEDLQPVRNEVFKIIKNHIGGIRIDTLIIEKRKTHPLLQEVEKFYPKMLGYLIRYIFHGCNASDYKEIIVITDQIPLKKKREAIIKGVKVELATILPTKNYRVLHHDSKSSFDLQIVDYCTWALYKKWDQNELRPYEIIAPAVKSEFDIFSAGTTFYY
jgi:hypothetical protein